MGHRNHGRKVTHRKGKTKMKRAKPAPLPVLALKLRPKKAPAVKPIVTLLCRTW